MSAAIVSRCACRGTNAHRIHRWHQGIPLCNSCYVREFPKRACSRCSTTARIHRSAVHGLCPSCDREARRCIRCERAVPRAALRLATGVVCPSCRPHFDPPVKKSVAPAGHRATCSGCGKHRRIAAMSLERRPLCPKCTDPGNAAIAKAQDLRYWAKRRVREWHIVANKFEEPAIQAFVFGFGTYLEHRFGPAKACLDIEAQVTRLRLLLSRTKNNIAPPKEQLLLLYTHAETRQAESLLDYMATIGLAVPSRPEFLAQSEARRCLTAIAEINEHAGQTHVVTYFSELCSDSRIQPSTRRVAVRAAVELLKSHGWPMTQPAVDRFVRAHRGHYAALGRFLSFLNRHGYELSLPPKQKSRVRKSRSDGFVVCMRQGAAATKFEDLRAATLGILVGYTGFALSDFLSLRREHADMRTMQRRRSRVSDVLHGSQRYFALGLGGL
jgi:hypothetical protein